MQNKISGVYKITNKVTGDFYIGSSKDIKARWANHKCSSNWKLQPNSRLYKDMAEFGLDSFTFEIIEETDNLKEREQFWIGQLKPNYNNYRASGVDTERCKETRRRYYKIYYKIHQEEWLAQMREYRNSHQEELKEWHRSHQAEINNYNNRLCLYEGEILTFQALSRRFIRQRIPHPCIEAKKYLL